MHTTVACSILSLAIPISGYAVLFLIGLAPAGLSEARVYLPLVVFNAVGLGLSVIALSRSNPRPVDISARMRLVVLLGALGLLANIIAAEYVLSMGVLHIPVLPPE